MKPIVFKSKFIDSQGAEQTYISATITPQQQKDIINEINKGQKSEGDDTTAGTYTGSGRDVYERGYDYQLSDLKSSTMPQLTGVANAMKSLGLKGIAENLEKVEAKYKAVLNVATKTTYEFFSAYDSRYRKFRTSLQSSLGGMPVNAEKATNAVSQKLLDGYDEIMLNSKKFGDQLSDERLELEVDVGDGPQKLNLINAALGGGAETMAKFQSLIENYANTVGPRFADALKGQEFEVARFQKGLGLSQKNIGDLLRRQIALTGEAGTEILDDVQTFSYAVADATGGNAKLIAQQTAEIIADVKNFGNVTVEEASRIAGAVQKAGIEFSTFNRMLGQFQNFESATSAMSDLTAVFGIHMDSMELMMLANEDQEEFLYRIKEGFDAQGLAMEDMNLAQKRVLADTMSMSVEQAELFFQEGALPDQAEMQQATMTADAEAAVKRLNEDITNVLQQGGKIEDILTMGLDEAFIQPLEKAAYFSSNAILSSTAVLGDTLKEAAGESADNLANSFEDLQKAMASPKPEAAVRAVFKKMGQDLASGVGNGAELAVKNIKDHFVRFTTNTGWWKQNIAPGSPSKALGMPLYEGIKAGVDKAVEDVESSFTTISESVQVLVANTGLPNLLDDLNDATMIATGVVGDRLGGVSESIQVLNEANLDNLPKMVEKIDALNNLISRHIAKIEEGTETQMHVNLKLDNDVLFNSLYNYRHTSGGTIKIDSGEIKGG